MNAETLAIRFGYGLPAGAQDAAALLAAFAGPDRASVTWPGILRPEVVAVLTTYKTEKKAGNTATAKAAILEAEGLTFNAAKAIFARAVGSDDPLRERMVAFWTDHFTVVGRNPQGRMLTALLIDEAIRPHVAGRFADMLRAVTMHPAMLIYLNQEVSFGPNSPKGTRQKKGLNENLARELLELHTLGVGAGYNQTDVRELAELLTGMTVDPDRGFTFDPRQAEPGPETVLGVTYDGEGLEPILALLDDLAARPETARHIAGKLATHFVADTPAADLVTALETTFLATNGSLLALAETLVTHPAALAPAGGKARQPFDFLVAAFRALDISPQAIIDADKRAIKQMLLNPLIAMGQTFQTAPGPDGWPEEAESWITPQGLAARIDWAMRAPQKLVKPLPDPREFLRTALGGQAGERLIWAVSAAESARDGVGLVLASPEFNKR